VKIALLIPAFLFLSYHSIAQNVIQDSIYVLPAIEVSSTKIDILTTGQKVIKFDSLDMSNHRSENISQLLTRNSVVNIRSYSGISSISMRGASAQHTSLVWNGFSINPSNIGAVDLSLIPTGHFNTMKLMFGGGSSLFGSGAIGGSLHLASQPVFKKRTIANIVLSAGSFGNYNGEAGFVFSSGKWYSKTSFLLKSAKNDFSYSNLYGETEKMQNNQTEQLGFIQDAYRKINKATIGTSVWYQQNKQEIPPSLTEVSSDAFQDDHSLRSVVSYVQSFTAAELSVKGAFFHDRLNYVDPDENIDNLIDSKIETNKTSVESMFSKSFFESSIFKAGVNFSNEQGVSNNWEDGVVRRQLGLFVYWVQEFKSIKWKLDIKLRQDFTDGYAVPFTPALGFEGAIYRNFYGKMSVSKNFRVPTFNDLFWIGSGNQDLNPENSWNEEIGLLYKNEKPKHFLNGSFEFTGFSSQVDDWIIWVPDGSLFRPQNIQKVWSRGVEFQGKLGFNIRTVKLNLNAGYTFTKSTNEKSLGDFDNSYNKQLIYTPENRFYASLTADFYGFVFSFSESFTGKQYVSTDNLESIPAFHTVDISLSKTINLLGQILTFQGEVLNLWNAEYVAYRFYPMPGRSYKFSVILSLK